MIKKIKKIPRINIKDLYIIMIPTKHTINKDFSFRVISLIVIKIIVLL
jgi:hypothetical protein